MSAAQLVGLDGLSEFPLPSLVGASDKEGRGRVLVVAGGGGVPGAGILTGVAALRAGAGKLQLAAPRSLAPALGMAVPEAAVIGLLETEDGEMSPEGAQDLHRNVARADAVVVGPGMMDEAGAGALALALIAIGGPGALVIDAAAMTGLDLGAPALADAAGRLVLTPHAGEMAKLSGRSKSAVEADPLEVARIVARTARAVVIMKGAESFIVSPDGRAWRHTEGGIGLATSGSGDVLAGVIGGLLARGASPLVASVWGVCVHGSAGARLARSIGPVGFLARELLDEVPRVMANV
jgi:hydroxyethylthiazole kinase-like uncharacterized protein yjeF